MAIENTQSSLMTVRIHWSGVNDDSPGCLILYYVPIGMRHPSLGDASTEELIPPNLSLSFEGTTDLFLDRFPWAIM
jgi:hypothetical protein